MNQKLILLHSKEQKSSFLDARKSARVTTQSPFFHHCSTEGRHTKLNSKFSFSRHMLQCMHSLSRAIFHKIFHTRQCKIPDTHECLQQQHKRRSKLDLSGPQRGDSQGAVAMAHLSATTTAASLEVACFLLSHFPGESLLLSDRME